MVVKKLYICNHMRKCIKCLDKKPLKEFHLRDSKKGTYRNICKNCSSLYKKEHYKKNKQKYVKKSKLRNHLIRNENSIKICEYLSDKFCVDCGENNILVLEFDHIEPKDKSFNVTTALYNSWGTIKKEINKCEIRCCNCHRIRTHHQIKSKRLKYILNE